ncbi:uncharacterized protein LOC127244394 isoform X2 [Andrographis paniculata]|nr:uncharacterized protein LOC127244394 isoform X2 [Andrographis paniculata]
MTRHIINAPLFVSLQQGYKVLLHVYDLSQGLARQMSTTFLGKAIEAIWHTGIVVYGNEYFFGGGIQCAPAGKTPYGTPIRIIDLGVTHIPKDVFEMYLNEISPRYTTETYSLLSHNCNNFSSEVAQFLASASIPDYILSLPTDVLNTPMGALILPMLQRLELSLRVGAVPQEPQFKPSTAATAFQSENMSVSAGSTESTKTNDEDVDQESKTESMIQENLQTTNKADSPSNMVVEKPSDDTTARDPLGELQSRVRQEIGKEFASIMASGTYHASEAAALATRRVMQKYGSTKTAES